MPPTSEVTAMTMLSDLRDFLPVAIKNSRKIYGRAGVEDWRGF
jgi:hypothetical protein